MISNKKYHLRLTKKKSKKKSQRPICSLVSRLEESLSTSALGHHNVHDHNRFCGDLSRSWPCHDLHDDHSRGHLHSDHNTPTTSPVLVVQSITAIIRSRIVWTFVYNIRIIANLTKDGVEAGSCSFLWGGPQYLEWVFLPEHTEPIQHKPNVRHVTNSPHFFHCDYLAHNIRKIEGRDVMAASASPVVSIATKPNPRDSRECGSCIMDAFWT